MARSTPYSPGVSIVTQTVERTRPTIIRIHTDAELERWPDIPEAELLEGHPIQHGLTLLDVPGYGLSAGLWSCTAQTSAPFIQPSHEFMLLLEGEVTIVEARGETTFRAGDAFVLPQGLRCQWRQPGLVRKIWMTFEDPDLDNTDESVASGLHAILVDPTEVLEASPRPPASILVSEPPVQHARDVFVDPTGQFQVGLWDTTAYRRVLVPFDRWELMHSLDGEATLADASGHLETLAAGGTIIAPLGTPTTWDGAGYLKKVYCLFRPAP